MAKTNDGFFNRIGDPKESGLPTSAAAVHSLQSIDSDHEFDVIIIGAGFAGLIAARELSRRDRRVLLVDARDRIGGRTFTAHVDDRNFEIGGTWIHWSQPHVWTEVTRYGLTLKESAGATADQLNVLLENGTKLFKGSTNEYWGAMGKAMETYTDVDGVQGRIVMPLPHTPLAANDQVEKYDQLSLKDRLDQMSSSMDKNDPIYLMLLSLLSMSVQGSLDDGSFIDHLRWWALGDYDMTKMFDKLGRYKIKEGTSALAMAILNDCKNVQLLLSTPIRSIDRTNSSNVLVRTESNKIIRGRTVIVTIPLNALSKIEFIPSLEKNKSDAIQQGQCRGGTKFWVKIEKPVGPWFAFAPYPNPITMAYTDDKEGSIVVGFGPDDYLDIENVNMVENELNKLLPGVKIEYLLSHDWRKDPYVLSTWSWYKPKQMSSNLVALQQAEPPLFFASGDIANGWRGFIDGAIESGLVAVRQIENYFKQK